jgi:hypothetical protein
MQASQVVPPGINFFSWWSSLHHYHITFRFVVHLVVMYCAVGMLLGCCSQTDELNSALLQTLHTPASRLHFKWQHHTRELMKAPNRPQIAVHSIPEFTVLGNPQRSVLVKMPRRMWAFWVDQLLNSFLQFCVTKCNGKFT